MINIMLGRCTKCDKCGLFYKEAPDHVLHLVISVITSGIWLLVWAAIVIMTLGHSWKCATCHEPLVPVKSGPLGPPL